MPYTPGPWYEAKTGNDQGLVISEQTGENIAVSYKKENAPLIATAPRLLDSLQELSAWMRFHTGPGDNTQEMLTRALIAIEAAGEKPRDDWGK